MKELATTCLFSMFISTSTSDGIFNYRLVNDYLQWNNILADLFVTFDDSIELVIRIGHKNMSKNMSDFNYQQFLVRTSYPICDMVNWNME